ncbi:type II secretion system protein [Aquabacterium sp. CECT 9606]|uniref:type II secretion system protein n=1 Tax=Aquabacterium sp. CECT 9606 TaxID=2845822 RepID=UPI001E3CA1F4|nr:type II secretion system protein [Aquabacterium sp. CECT 9606]
MTANRSTSGEQGMTAPAQHRQNGFTYIGVLMAIAFMGIGLLAISEVWTTTAERQKMAQLDWVGEQYVQAIQSYYYANTGSLHIYPSKLEDLLEDKRHLSIKRHIRTLYANPFTNGDSWQTLPAPGGGIQGIEYQRRDSDYPVTKQFVFVPAVSGSR